jgi:predicted amidophosphoribosyltransferase
VQKPQPHCNVCKKPVDIADAHCRHCGARLYHLPARKG